jgi:hypothetical protein
MAKLPLRDIMKGLPPSNKLQAERMFDACHGKRIFVTDLGHMGLVPEDARLGNSVFILESVDAPMVFRNGIGIEGESPRE